MERQDFRIDGYWVEDNASFDGYIVTNFDDVDEDSDEDIFFYGISEDEIKKAIETKEISLKSFEIIQVRGYNNTPTKYNAKIKSIITQNIHKIQAIAQKRKAS